MKIKTFFWGFTFVYMLFAINIYEGETAQLKNSRVRQKNNRRIVKTTPWNVARNPNPQNKNVRQQSRRISETKCLDYIRERSVPEPPQHGNKYATAFAIGGRNALDGEFPHLVRHDMAIVSKNRSFEFDDGAVGWRTRDRNWSFKCGSSLVSHKFSLTAAHCSRIPLDDTIAKREPEIVRLGDTNIRVDVKSIDAIILRIIVHPQYKSPSKYYDIALVEFKSLIRFSITLHPVCLWSKFDTRQLGTKVSSAGWGVTNIVSKSTSPILQAIEIDMMDSEVCSRQLRRACNKNWCGVREHQICAGKLAGGVDACQGDSGGPLQVKRYLSPPNGGTVHILIGVTSFGIGCGHAKHPGVYTRVSSFIDWIERIVWPH